MVGSEGRKLQIWEIVKKKKIHLRTNDWAVAICSARLSFSTFLGSQRVAEVGSVKQRDTVTLCDLQNEEQDAEFFSRDIDMLTNGYLLWEHYHP